MNAIAIIPARYASTRFPGKPLALIDGISMIERVYRQAQQATSLTEILVATDDQKILDHVKSFGGNVCLTNSSHQSGTDRIAEAYTLLNKPFDVIINIQGDEPFINPDEINRLINCFTDNSVQIATMAKQIKDASEFINPNVVKVLIKKNNDAIYFSRQAIPYIKNQQADEAVKQFSIYKHIGIYSFKAQTLLQITQLKQTQLEMAESLEQLRWLENNYTIRVIETQYETLAVDTPGDLTKIEAHLKVNNKS